MTLTEKQLTHIVGKILNDVKDLQAGDGIDALAAALSSAIISANATKLFDKVDLHPFLMELENRLNKTLQVLDLPKQKFTLKRSN